MRINFIHIYVYNMYRHVIYHVYIYINERTFNICIGTRQSEYICYVYLYIFFEGVGIEAIGRLLGSIQILEYFLSGFPAVRHVIYDSLGFFRPLPPLHAHTLPPTHTPSPCITLARPPSPLSHPVGFKL